VCTLHDDSVATDFHHLHKIIVHSWHRNRKNKLLFYEIKCKIFRQDLKKKLSGKSIDMDILTHEEGMRNKLFIVYGLV
jgi:hypothetical protein